MSERFVLGIDLGTSSCKVRVVNRHGVSVGSRSEGYETLSPQPGYAEQRPEDWMPAVKSAVAESLEMCGVEARDVVVIGLTSAAHIGVLLGEDKKPLRAAILWQDQRTSREAAELDGEAGEEILRISGNRVSPSWTLPHLVWIRRHEPEVWRRLVGVVFSKDYLLGQLTGEWATDPGTAVAGQLYDVNAGGWSARLCEMAGLSEDMLPQVAPGRAVVGGLTRQAAKFLGLRQGTPVVNGCLDSAAELLAANAVEPGAAVVRLASAGGVQLVVERPKLGRLITYPHLAEPHWYQQAGTSTCATAVQWARDLFGPSLSWREWDEEARSVPAGCQGLAFHPYLAGERAPLWNSEVRGSFMGIGLHHGVGHFARAVYEGTAYSIRHAMGVFDQTIGDGTALPVVGGGSRSSIWLEILSAVLERPLKAAVDADSALGAAFLAWQALGENPKSADAAVEIRGQGSYAAQFEKYMTLSAALVEAAK